MGDPRERLDRLLLDTQVGMGKRGDDVRREVGHSEGAEDADHVSHHVPAGVRQVLQDRGDRDPSNTRHDLDDRLPDEQVLLLGEGLEQRPDGALFQSDEHRVGLLATTDSALLEQADVMRHQFFGGHFLDPEAGESGDLVASPGRSLYVPDEDRHRLRRVFDLPLGAFREEEPRKLHDVPAVGGGVGLLRDPRDQGFDRDDFPGRHIVLQRVVRGRRRVIGEFLRRDLLEFFLLQEIRESVVVHPVCPDPRHFHPKQDPLQPPGVLDFCRIQRDGLETRGDLARLEVGKEDDPRHAPQVQLPVEVDDRLVPAGGQRDVPIEEGALRDVDRKTLFGQGDSLEQLDDLRDGLQQDRVVGGVKARAFDPLGELGDRLRDPLQVKVVRCFRALGHSIVGK